MSARQTAADRARALGLTDREVLLLRHVARGRSNAYMAKDLSCTEERVAADLVALCNKLDVLGRGGLARWWQHRVEEAFSGVPAPTRRTVVCFQGEEIELR